MRKGRAQCVGIGAGRRFVGPCRLHPLPTMGHTEGGEGGWKLGRAQRRGPPKSAHPSFPATVRRIHQGTPMLRPLLIGTAKGRNRSVQFTGVKGTCNFGVQLTSITCFARQPPAIVGEATEATV